MSENDKEEKTNKIDIKNKRKSMIIKRDLIDFEEFNDKNEIKESSNTKTNSIKVSSISKNTYSELKLLDKKEENNENLNMINNLKNRRARKSIMLRPMIGLSKYVTLKGQLTNISELLIQQESDISELLCGCQQPNNYHVYLRERNGQLSYIYKLREFSGTCNRVFCPVNCRQFTMKMKLMNESSNKYDKNFSDSLMTIQRDFKIPIFCLIRPEMIINLDKEKLKVGKVEQSFSFCDPCFTIYNENNEEIYFIEADCCQCGFFCRNYSLGKTDDCQFLIYNSKEKKKPLGYIVKKTESVYSIADNYHVTFPSKIPPEDKLLLSIVAVSIDYHYYEKNNEVIK